MVKRHFHEEPENHSRQGGDESAENGSETRPNNTDKGLDLTAAWAAKRFEIFELEALALQRISGLLKKAASGRSRILAGITKNNARIKALSQRLDSIDQRLESLESEIQRVWQQVGNMSPAIGALDKNLQQVRVLVERTADRVDRFSDGFVEREVREPLLVDIGGIYHALQEAMLNGSDGIRAVAEYARVLLESKGVSLIEPEQGEPFNPAEHLPIQKISTPSKILERRIAEPRRIGLRFNGRVIQQALVALYTTQQNET
jgi:molecular chaperone GrpE (heat shock protein)